MNNMRIESESLESEMISDMEREENAGNIESSPCVYLPFLKGTSVDERERMRIYLIE